MAFADHATQTNRKTAVAGVTAIHAIIGVVLVTGLAGGAFMPDEDTPLKTTVFKTPPPPPPPEPDEAVEPQKPTAPLPYVPPPPMPINNSEPTINTAPELPDLADIVIRDAFPEGDPVVPVTPQPTPKPVPTFSPIAAKPSNDPGRWITESDYRTSWINRGMTGIASFKVTVGTTGKVQNCQIVASTGHSALDNATCKLVSQRARFDAARDSSGNKVSGSYRTSVKWEVPR
ncbi:hypothetical protein GCM10023115_12600 [Pontixanthobacter gangjinensis]